MIKGCIKNLHLVGVQVTNVLIGITFWIPFLKNVWVKFASKSDIKLVDDLDETFYLSSLSGSGSLNGKKHHEELLSCSDITIK